MNWSIIGEAIDIAPVPVIHSLPWKCEVWGVVLVMKLWAAWVATVATVRRQTHGKASEIWVFASAKSFLKIRLHLMGATDFWTFPVFRCFQVVLYEWQIQTLWDTARILSTNFKDSVTLWPFLIFHLAWQKGHASLSWVPARFSTRSCKLVAVSSKWTQSRFVSSFFYSRQVVRCVFSIHNSCLSARNWFLDVSRDGGNELECGFTNHWNDSECCTTAKRSMAQMAWFATWFTPEFISLVPKTAVSPMYFAFAPLLNSHLLKQTANQCPGQTGSFTVRHSNDGRQRSLPTETVRAVHV